MGAWLGQDGDHWTVTRPPHPPPDSGVVIFTVANNTIHCRDWSVSFTTVHKDLHYYRQFLTLPNSPLVKDLYSNFRWDTMFLCVYDTVLINSNKKKNQNTVNSDVNIEELSHRWYTVCWLGWWPYAATSPSLLGLAPRTKKPAQEARLQQQTSSRGPLAAPFRWAAPPDLATSGS